VIEPRVCCAGDVKQAAKHSIRRAAAIKARRGNGRLLVIRILLENLDHATARARHANEALASGNSSHVVPEFTGVLQIDERDLIYKE
jgi:hypothetical protein